MCTFVNKVAKIRRSFRKVTCWKAVEWDNEKCMWTGPFYGGDSYVEGKKLKSDKRIYVVDGVVYHGLHTYTDESCAFKLLSRLLVNRMMGNYRLVKCEIPRFSRYIEGADENGAPCYVSEKLKVVKFV